MRRAQKFFGFAAANLPGGEMQKSNWRTVLIMLVALSSAACAYPQNADSPAYLNPSLPAEQRAADLVGRMTVEEKVTQLVNYARAIPRLNIPAYDWWSESLHGVLSNGTTEFPEPVGLGSTFDAPAIHNMAIAISTEGRIKHAQDVRAGHSNLFEGLDFWAPNINIFRDPRWGRGQETYGEDPFLTAHMGVAFVTGMQGDDPKYFKTISTPKHYAVHSGPESTRHTADVTISKHDQLDTYLPAFRATVTEAKADSVMCAYNSINGEPACANRMLLGEYLRGDWKFEGYVVSDCAAGTDISEHHRFKPTMEEGVAVALKTGMDLFCGSPQQRVHTERTAVLNAVQQGILSEADIDRALIRLFTARFRLGMFDPPALVPWSGLGASANDTPAHRQLALKTAREAIVLLKNENHLLPLKKVYPRIAVIGPDADSLDALEGNYNGTPSAPVTILQGIRRRFANAKVVYVEGTGLLGPVL